MPEPALSEQVAFGARWLLAEACPVRSGLFSSTQPPHTWWQSPSTGLWSPRNCRISQTETEGPWKTAPRWTALCQENEVLGIRHKSPWSQAHSDGSDKLCRRQRLKKWRIKMEDKILTLLYKVSQSQNFLFPLNFHIPWPWKDESVITVTLLPILYNKQKPWLCFSSSKTRDITTLTLILWFLKLLL